MAISDRITSIEEHLKESYQELEGIGIDTTGVNNNLENIPKLIDGYWETLPKVTGEGTLITLDNTKEGKMKINLKGNTSQEGTPTPDSPIPIQVVSGNNIIEICGKNLFDKSKVVTGFLIENGTIYDTLNYNTSDYIIVEPNTSYYKTATSSPRTKYYDKNKQPLNTTTYKDISIGGNEGTFTTPNNAYYLRFSYPITTVDANSIMLHKGTTASTYEPYNGDTYNIDLPSGMELCKIGNYQDYFYKDSGKWYLHKEIGKKVYEGSEYFGYGASGETGISVVNTGGIGMKQGNYLGGKSNYFMNNQSGKLVNTIRFGANDTNLWIYISSSEFSSADDFKTWVSTHNIEVYYILATPTTTEITDSTLLSQLNALAKSYASQTNISQESNDLPSLLNATALEEME